MIAPLRVLQFQKISTSYEVACGAACSCSSSPFCHSNGFGLMATGNGAESATRMDGKSLSLTSGTKRTVVMLVVAVHK